MRKIAFILFCSLFIIPSCAQKKKIAKKKSTPTLLIQVNGVITQTFSYCGGAAPPEDMLRELATPKPFADLILYFRKDSNNLKNAIVKEVKTDSLGRFMVSLPAGKYIIVDGRKKDKATFDKVLKTYEKETPNNQAVDKNCLIQFFATPDYELTIPNNSKEKISLTYNYYKDCNWSGHPCVEFRGPYPP